MPKGSQELELTRYINSPRPLGEGLGVREKSNSRPSNSRLQKRVAGIEPATKAWEAFILPLNYTRALRHNITNQTAWQTSQGKPYLILPLELAYTLMVS